MHAMEGAFKVFLQGVERDVDCVFTGDQHIVLTGPGGGCSDGRHGGLEAAADTIAFDGAAHCFSDRKAEARRRADGRGFETLPCFQNKRGRRAPRPAPNAQEFRSLSEGRQFHVRASSSSSERYAITRNPLGREALAALRATAGENPHATWGFHALAEAMPALAHKLARLIGALHDTLRLIGVPDDGYRSCQGKM
jgi:hypothetical protein